MMMLNTAIGEGDRMATLKAARRRARCSIRAAGHYRRSGCGRVDGGGWSGNRTFGCQYGLGTGAARATQTRENPRFGGLSVARAVDNVIREIAPTVIGLRDLDDQSGLDGHLIALDGTPNKSRARGQRGCSAFPWPSPTRRRPLAM